MRRHAFDKPTWTRALALILTLGSLAFLTGCGDLLSVSGRDDNGDWDEVEWTAEEKRYVEATGPFVQAITANEYEKAYALLSRHARARMSKNQFIGTPDDKQFERNEKNALRNVTFQEFESLMGKMVRELGRPVKVIDNEVFSTEPDVLSGKEKLEAIFAIGAMPKSIPNDIRRASIRTQIGTRLSEARMKAIAEEVGLHPQDLEDHEEFAPYLTLKMVVVEDAGQLKVGYFEFLPPSVWD